MSAYCNEFDASLAAHGPAAVFLLDRDGLLRFDETWTRDCWGRNPGPHAGPATWLLLRDRGSGFVSLAWVGSSDLLDHHPRLETRAYDTRETAEAAREAFGVPPICHEAWA